jgi:hypothetical protein
MIECAFFVTISPANLPISHDDIAMATGDEGESILYQPEDSFIAPHSMNK